MDAEVDRLSSLSDDLIYKILSYVDIEYCIRLSVLSSRWRFIWTSMPYLNFSCREYYASRYYEFVNNLLSVRNNKIDVSSVSLDLHARYESSVKRILEYAFSHNVQQLTIGIRNLYVPTSLLCFKSLKHLTMIRTSFDRSHSPWDLPALTTVHLKKVELSNWTSILAMCHNLKNLTLERCQAFNEDGRTTVSVHCLTISARDLTYLRIKGPYFPKLSLDGFRSLEKVDFCISSPETKNAHKIFDLFQRLHSVKSLALSLEIIELHSNSEEVISHQPSPFPSLKSLKIYPLEGLKTLALDRLRTYPLTSILDLFPSQLDQEQEAMKIILSAEAIKYLLDSCSNATFTMVSHEEARAIKLTKVAHRFMAALWKELEEMEAYTETKRAKVELKKTLADSCSEDFKMNTWPWSNTEVIFCMLKNIKLLLTKVLASKRVEMQACFSRLSAKTKTVVNKVVVDMKNQCDINQRIFSGYLDEIAMSS
ncbi:F-box domain, Leucine-rich repeat domain, L domain-like protein [Artemisia annua]|uniref:F-box domain, Leucine-rich repeat domain, L domain-like protein n=1 Tax=Artemisia annua TaxID=35608 RepID=A0A2U1NB64_ARTAN|nr:F-box domain, Leucine-rich repeat domain, L domain-like protein [Artemisia annua]